MFCIVAFIVLSILGIFSAANRRLAKEALDCVLRRITFRPCNTGFDEKMKAKILGKVIMRSEKLASFINKRFEILAWAFLCHRHGGFGHVSARTCALLHHRFLQRC